MTVLSYNISKFVIISIIIKIITKLINASICHSIRCAPVSAVKTYYNFVYHKNHYASICHSIRCVLVSICIQNMHVLISFITKISTKLINASICHSIRCAPVSAVKTCTHLYIRYLFLRICRCLVWVREELYVNKAVYLLFSFTEA